MFINRTADRPRLLDDTNNLARRVSQERLMTFARVPRKRRPLTIMTDEAIRNAFKVLTLPTESVN